MAHDISDHLQALKNQLLERRRKLEADERETLKRIRAEMRKLEETAKMVADMQHDLPSLLGDESSESDANAADESDAQIPWQATIERYIESTGSTSMTAADVKRYAGSIGYKLKDSSYNSAHEALRKRVERGEMLKDGAKFVVKGEQ